MGKSFGGGKCSPQVWFGIFISFLSCFILLTYDYSSTYIAIDYGVNLLQIKHSHPIGIKNQSLPVTKHSSIDSCSGRYIYIHDDLPAKFNFDLINNCESVTHGMSYMKDMCLFVKNFGFGPRIKESKGVLSKKRWFETNQFSLALIFHSKMKRYKCLTRNAAQAAAIYIPIYPGFEHSKHLLDPNLTARDEFGKDFARWVSSRPEWKRMWGRDHFFVSGRVGFDYARKNNNISEWGSNLRLLPESLNMTMLTIEGASLTNDIAIPYPSGFHPAHEIDVLLWQDKVRKLQRPYLFAFVGGPRPNTPYYLRGKLYDQCKASKHCIGLNCKSKGIICEETATAMRVFEKSVYCLQPNGDTFTRKSTFDAILAGCIPVFFHPASAYRPYKWHLPKRHAEYSVFIPVKKAIDLEDGEVERVLLGISKEKEVAMREEVIRLIPKVVYGDPKSRLESKDAFDIAVEKMLERIENVRKVMREGKDPSVGFAEDGKKFKFSNEAE